MIVVKYLPHISGRKMRYNDILFQELSILLDILLQNYVHLCFNLDTNSAGVYWGEVCGPGRGRWVWVCMKSLTKRLFL